MSSVKTPSAHAPRASGFPAASGREATPSTPLRIRASGTVARYAETMGLAWALGMALFTSASFVCYLTDLSVATASGAALLAAAVGLLVGPRVLWPRRADATWTGIGVGSRFLCALGLSIVLIQVAVAAWIATHSLLRHGDAWTVWSPKARLFALGRLPHGYFTSHVWSTHPDYPLNLPLAESPFFRLPDPLGLTLASLMGTACLVALLLLFYAGLARLHGCAMAALAAAALALVPPMTVLAGYGYADVPLALYGGASALYLLLWWRCRQPSDLALMGLLAGGAIWTKKEGLLAALLLLLALVVGELVRRQAPRRARVFAIFGAMAATALLPLPWLVFTLVTHPVGRDFLPVTPSVFVAHVGRLPTIASYLLREALNLGRWGLFWPTVGGAVVVALAARRLGLVGWGLLLLLTAQLGLDGIGYVFSDWSPYTAHIDTSLYRLMLQVVPLAILLLVEAVGALKPRR